MLTGLSICPHAYDFQYKRKTNCSVWKGRILKLLSFPYYRLLEANTPSAPHSQCLSLHQITRVQLKINFGPREQTKRVHHASHEQRCYFGNWCELKSKGTDLTS